VADAQLRAVITAEDKASKVIAGVGQSLEQTKGKLEGALDFAKKLTPAFAVLGAATVGFAAKGVIVAGQLEAMRQGFVTLLGSAEAADKTMARIKQEAARTPFELPGLTSATQALALVTKDGDKAIDVLLNVGKALATAGKGQAELDRIISNLQQIALTGKITEMDIRQFGMNGINVLELLADYYGTTTEKASEMVKNSKDAFADLTGAFQKAGTEGGKFAEGFTNQAGTFQQQWSNLKDNINIALSDLVKTTGVFDLVKQALGRINEVIPALVEGIKSTVEWLKDLASKWDEVIGKIKGFVDQVLQAATVQNILNALKDAFDRIWIAVKDNLWPALQQLWNTILQELWPALQQLWEALKPLAPYFELMGKVVGAVLVVALLFLIQVLEKVILIIVKVIEWWAKLTAWVITEGKPIIEEFANVIEGVANAFSSVVSWVDKALSKINEFVNRVAKVNLNPLSGSFNIPFLSGRASGGSVSPNRSFIVGENGAELFTPQTYGTISNGGGAAINIYLSGNTFMGREGIAERIGDDLMRIIKRNVQL
jgi:tape measure domain-containing protein